MEDLVLGWIAGLLEGEGCFHLERGRYPRISLQMADEDVVRRLAELTGMGGVRGPYYPSGRDHKPIWRWLVCDRTHVETLLRLIQPLMGTRRQAKIEQCLNFSPKPRGPRTHCRLRNHPLTPSNIYVSPGGHRFCVACYVIRNGYPPKS
jgi:LAGLIDADG-like domain